MRHYAFKLGGTANHSSLLLGTFFYLGKLLNHCGYYKSSGKGDKEAYVKGTAIKHGNEFRG